MTLTMEEVLHALGAIEPEYAEMAKLGPEALPYLAILVDATDILLASKAVSLASVIRDDRSIAILQRAAQSPYPEVRIAAAAGAGNLDSPVASEILSPLLSDPDSGVRKIALHSTPQAAPPALRTKIEMIAISDPEPFVRQLAEEVLRASDNSDPEPRD